MTTQVLTSKVGSHRRFTVTVVALGIVALLTRVLTSRADAGGDHDEMGMGGRAMTWLGNYGVFMVLGIVLWVIVAIMVSQDAYSRGENGLLWGVLVLIMPMMGLFVYLIFLAIRSSNPRIVAGSNASVSQVQPTRPVRSTPSAPVREVTVGSPVQAKPASNVQYCTACGSANSVDAKFCNTCGAELPKV